ncbi:hypothetical protein ZIOFF_029745 [Zingiber officinale]|uniref:Uncharacterized protein n=1 Tax=Zingiber officinale TaxID=94328 RepID=A0A8J5GPZ3_ZINOF|nr:hypothetical protein ZIOFF_029745 [Zingiber officinale]
MRKKPISLPRAQLLTRADRRSSPSPPRDVATGQTTPPRWSRLSSPLDAAAVSPDNHATANATNSSPSSPLHAINPFSLTGDVSQLECYAPLLPQLSSQPPKETPPPFTPTAWTYALAASFVGTSSLATAPKDSEQDRLATMVGNNKKSGGGGGGWKKGVEKTKVVATSGFRKVKESTSTGVNWIKDKYQQTTRKH